ncbi:hypothetical protein [Faecalibaculum rodentium]|uniref:hypothetical protein n=1 Tax=Faecalibaculum rodentium TaxID=1702221 RepID=UPI0027314B53|nr:hypothetical protein [Faecalibaculum rodentium]
MTETMQTAKKDATEFLLEQVMKLTPEQKRNLSYVLVGATMSQKLIGKADSSDTCQVAA